MLEKHLSEVLLKLSIVLRAQFSAFFNSQSSSSLSALCTSVVLVADTVHSSQLSFSSTWQKWTLWIK